MFVPVYAVVLRTQDDFDYFRLAHPEIADFVELTDRQRTEISSLVSQAAEQSATVEPGQRTAVTDQFRQKIADLLNSDQQQKLAQLPERQKLRFNFSNPSWEEVLRWFANQADLSLVMGSVPSGDFNYSDNREYTPAQAIDLLNSILLTKGFTLVRRDKLLILVEIKDGIPDEILPRVAPEDLDQRGTYEIVSVMFSLGNRPVEIVQAEIKPLIGSFGKVLLLPNSKQLLVTETVGKLKAIKILIESVPTPQPAAKTPEPPKEPSEVRAFPLVGLEPTTTVNALKELVPDAIISHEPNSRRVVIYGRVSKVKLAEDYLNQLRPDTDSVSSQPYLQPYDMIGSFDQVALLEQLNRIAPQSSLSFDATNRRLLVFGSQAQHQQIQEALSSLEIIANTGSVSAVRVFKLKRANPTVATDIAKAVAPRAAVTAAPDNSAIIVRAAEAELTIIDSLIQQLELEGSSPEDQVVLKTIECPQALPSEFLATLQSMAPTAKLQFDAARKVFVFIGVAEDFAKIENLVLSLNQQSSEKNDRELITHQLTAAQRNILIGMLEKSPAETADWQIIPSVSNNELIAWIPSAQVELLQRWVDQIKLSVPQEPQPEIKVYPLDDINQSDLVDLLKTFAPQAQVKVDPAASQFTVIGDGEAQQAVGDVLQQLVAAGKGRLDKTVKFYPLDRSLSSSALELIKELLPQIKATWDEPNERLNVIAAPREQEKLEQLLAQLNQNLPPRKQNQLQIYALTDDLKSRFEAILATYPQELGTVQVVSDQRPGELAVIAGDSQHELIKQIVQQLQAPIQGAQPHRIASYPTGDSTPEQLAEFLLGIFPTASIVVDDPNRRLMIWATESVHQQIDAAVQQMRDEESQAMGTQSSNRSFRSYRLQTDRPNDLVPILQRMVPGMELVADNRQAIIVAWGRESDHEVLSQAIDQLNLPVDPAGLVIELYPTDPIDPQQATQILTQLFPEITIVTQVESKTLTVLATKPRHTLIRQTLQQIAQSGGEMESMSIAVYQVPRTGNTNAITLLKSLIPSSQILPGGTTDRIVALASPSQHQRLTELVNVIESDSQNLTGKRLKTYQLKGNLAASIRQLLQTTFPSLVLISIDADRFATWAFEDEHLQIQALIADAEQQLTTEPQKYQTYNVGSIPIGTARSELLTRVPNLTMVELGDQQNLTVLANANDHDRVAQVLNDLGRLFKDQSETYLEAYRIEDVDLALVIEALPEALSRQIKIRPDVTTRSLIVTANSDQHLELTERLTVLENKLPKLETPIARIYPMGNLGDKEWTAMIKQLAPTATAVTDPKSSSLVVTASRQTHQLLQEVTDELMADMVIRRSVRVFPLNQADGKSLQTALTNLLPNCSVTFDPGNKNLIVTGSTDELEVAEQTIKQLDNRTDDVSLKSYWVTDMPAESLARALRDLFRNDPSVSVAAERGSRAVIAVASEDQHRMIDDLLKQSEFNRTAPDRMRQLRTWPLEQANGTTMLKSLEMLFENETVPPQISFDSSGNRIVALATEDQLSVIEQTLSDLTPPAQQFRVFRIQSIEADAAASALRSYFRSLPISLTPAIDVDYDSQQLLVRATAEQLEEIVTVLTELGEPQSAAIKGADRSETTRVLTGNRDWSQLVQQVDSIWPQLRQNVITLVDPENLEQLASVQSSVDSAHPAIIAVPQSQRLVLMSLDREALDQFENLLTILTRSTDPTGLDASDTATTKNFDVIPLKHAGANVVATQLRQMFKELERSQRGVLGLSNSRTPVVFGADERLNTLIVHGSRSDRQTVRELVKTLDSADAPINLLLDQPTIVPVRNTDANRIVTILNSIYKTQLSSGGGRKPVPIPEGLSPDVAIVLQQVNAASAGPLLTLGVDSITNSIIVRAPEQLQVQIQGVIEKLDQAVATQPGQEIEIIKFENSNPERIEKALDVLLQQRTRPRR